jgi:hypothetical protein
MATLDREHHLGAIGEGRDPSVDTQNRPPVDT